MTLTEIESHSRRLHVVYTHEEIEKILLDYTMTKAEIPIEDHTTSTVIFERCLGFNEKSPKYVAQVAINHSHEGEKTNGTFGT